jgi:hypothetical protein
MNNKVTALTESRAMDGQFKKYIIKYIIEILAYWSNIYSKDNNITFSDNHFFLNSNDIMSIKNLYYFIFRKNDR